MKRYQKTIIAVIVLVSVAVGFYFVGYKTCLLYTSDAADE